MSIQSGAIVSKVVHRDEIVNVTCSVSTPVRKLTEQWAARAALMQVITGRLRFTVDGEEIDAGPGFWPTWRGIPRVSGIGM